MESVLVVHDAERGSMSTRPTSPTTLPGPSTRIVTGSVRLTVMLSTTTSPSSNKAMKPSSLASPSLMKVVSAGMKRGLM